MNLLTIFKNWLKQIRENEDLEYFIAIINKYEKELIENNNLKEIKWLHNIITNASFNPILI